MSAPQEEFDVVVVGAGSGADAHLHPATGRPNRRMGSDDRAVLDPRLRVRGIEGLRVADLVLGRTAAQAAVPA